MKKYTILLSLSLGLILGACANEKKNDPILEEAFQLHQQAMTVEREVRAQLDKLPANTPVADRLRSRHKTWSENLVEVPGFEHEHHHDHGHDHAHDHDHDHGPTTEVTPEHMLAIQQEFLDSIRAIQSDVRRYIARQ